MTSLSGKTRAEKTQRDRLVAGGRWLCVLPAGVLAGFLIRFACGAVWQIAGAGGSDFASAFRVFLLYVPKQVAFVIAGATTAPRHQSGVALVLTVLGILLSLLIHVVVQHLAGNRVGATNYIHFVVESLGLLAGTAFVVWRVRTKQRTETVE